MLHSEQSPPVCQRPSPLAASTELFTVQFNLTNGVIQLRIICRHCGTAAPPIFMLYFIFRSICCIIMIFSFACTRRVDNVYLPNPFWTRLNIRYAFVLEWKALQMTKLETLGAHSASQRRSRSRSELWPESAIFAGAESGVEILNKNLTLRWSRNDIFSFYRRWTIVFIKFKFSWQAKCQINEDLWMEQQHFWQNAVVSYDTRCYFLF